LHGQSKFRSGFRVLVVRLGAMGDILHALPAVTALRRAHPSWVIDWLVEPAWRHLLTAANGTLAEPLSIAQPLVNELYLASVKAWGRSPLSSNTHSEIKQLRTRLRGGSYDVVVDFQGAVRSAFLGRLAGARRIIGESDPREWAARWLFTDRVATCGVHVIEQDLELASAIAGDALEPVRPALPVDAHAEEWCDHLLSPLGGQPLALLYPGAGWGSKRWPPERYSAVAAGLAARGFQVLVNAAPGEEGIADSIVAQSNQAAIAVRCSLAELIALTRRVALAIGGDTGPMHLACALGRPVVGIYGPTDPARNGPYGTRFRVLRSPTSVRNHARLEQPEAGLLTIAPEEVLDAAGEVLSREAAR
jgi:heptosyltransferase I